MNSDQPPPQPTIAEFLLARLEEDEDEAQCGTRLLAEVQAKRRIVQLHVVGDPNEWGPDQWACRLCQWDEDCDSPKHDHQYAAGRFPCDTLRALAVVYSDHPVYNEEWRP